MPGIGRALTRYGTHTSDCKPVVFHTNESEQNSDLLLPPHHCVFTKLHIEVVKREIILAKLGLISESPLKRDVFLSEARNSPAGLAEANGCILNGLWGGPCGRGPRQPLGFEGHQQPPGSWGLSLISCKEMSSASNWNGLGGRFFRHSHCQVGRQPGDSLTGALQDPEQKTS